MKIFNMAVVIIMMTGCSRQTSLIKVIGPDAPLVPTINTLILNQGITQVWDKILTKFTTSMFEINQIDDKIHYLSVTYTAAPELYIDCGKSVIETGGRNKTITNSSAQYQYKLNRMEFIDAYAVQNNFTGKAKILISGNESSTEITLHTILDLDVNVDYSTTQGIQHKTTRTYLLQLQSGEEKYFSAYDSTCRSTGIFEQSVINFLTD